MLSIACSSFSVRNEVFIKPLGNLITLPDSFIVDLSESLFCGESYISPERYSINRIEGIIKLNGEPICDSIKIVYSYIDLKIPLKIRHKVPSGTGGRLLERQPRVNMSMIPENNRLTHSGSLLRGIKIGSRRDASVESAFQLEAFGSIGEDVEITAMLSDQDLPIQPEGTSEKIAQLDQVFISIKGPFFSANFGDFNATFAQGEFSSYNRRLSGVQLKGFSDKVTGEIAGAILEGIWASYEFTCSEGNQGPYQVSVNENSSVQILAGSEVVWLNGSKLDRGLDNDYTIDYNLGQITFTSNRQVGINDRVIIDFQYTDLEFRRSFYGLSGNIDPFEKLKFSYSAMIEADDSHNPLTLEFSEEELAALEVAGDNADSAYMINATLSDTGDYFLVDSATSNEHFEWIGDGDGDWDVVFENVGSGKGDYNYISLCRYEYVGSDFGSFRPIRSLPLPISHSVIDIGTEFEPVENMKISGEVATSSIDLNRLSSSDDNDNSDGAYLVKLDLTRGLVFFGSDIGEVNVNAKLRHKGERFSSIGRMDDAEFLRDWGVSEKGGGEELAEGSIVYKPIEPLEITAAYGSNVIGDSDSKRLISSISYHSTALNINGNSSNIRSLAKWNKYWGDISGKLWFLEPKTSALFEDKSGEAGFRFYQIESSIGFLPLERVSFVPGIEYRYDEKSDSMGLMAYSQVKTYKLSSKIYDWQIVANHREFEDLTGFSNNIKSDIGSVNGSIRMKIPRSDLRLRYELSREQSEVLEPFYEFVGYGSGNYEYDVDRNEYIPSVGGDYLKKYLPTGIFTPSINSDLKANLSVDFSDLEGNWFAMDYIRALSFDGFIRNEGSSSKSSVEAYLLDPSDMLSNEYLLLGRFLTEGNIRIGSRRSRSLTLHRRYNKYRNAQFTTGEEIRWANDYEIEGRLSFSKIGNFTATTVLSNSARIYPDNSRTGTELKGQSLIISWNKMLSNRFQTKMNASYLVETDNWPEEPMIIDRTAINPGLTYFFDFGNLRVDFQYSRVLAGDEYNGILPYDMAEGDFIGDNGKLSLSTNVDIATGTTINLSYDLLSRTGRLPEHTATASVRLVF